MWERLYAATIKYRCSRGIKPSHTQAAFETSPYPMKTPSATVTRRQFVRTAAGAAALISAPLIIPSRLLGADAPSNRIRVGHIGCGRIASGHDMPGVFSSGLADMVAV